MLCHVLTSLCDDLPGFPPAPALFQLFVRKETRCGRVESPGERCTRGLNSIIVLSSRDLRDICLLCFCLFVGTCFDGFSQRPKLAFSMRHYAADS